MKFTIWFPRSSYFSENGSNYSLVRVPMGGTDFSTRPYTYDDNVTQSVTGKTEDLDLAYFALQPEDYDLKVSNRVIG
jgi:glucosylceramidase